LVAGEDARYRRGVRLVTIVNGAAGAPRLARKLGPLSEVAVTASLVEARAALRQAVRSGVELVVFAGGDGTAVMGLALLAEAARGLGRPEPAIAVLRMGTGNALADALGASDDPVADLRRLAAGGGRARVLPLVEVAGVRAPFAGIGVDAQLLEDQAAVGRTIARVPVVGAWMGRVLGGGARYAVSVPMRSLPRFATEDRPEVVVRNAGAPAIAVGRDGPTGAVVPSGGVLWAGPCTMVAAATIPYFGFGLKMFAHGQDRIDRFQLRASDAGLGEILRNTRAAFGGRYYSAHTHDFLCERVVIEAAREVAVEAGGELLAPSARIEIGMGRSVTAVGVGGAEKQPGKGGGRGRGA
jgi:diacylglycerol kinase family enzyme